MKKQMHSKEGQWERLDIHKVASEWMQDPNTNQGIVISAHDSEGRSIAEVNAKDRGDYVSF